MKDVSKSVSATFCAVALTASAGVTFAAPDHGHDGGHSPAKKSAPARPVAKPTRAPDGHASAPATARDAKLSDVLRAGGKRRTAGGAVIAPLHVAAATARDEHAPPAAAVHGDDDEAQDGLTPADAITRLKEGNGRYVSGEMNPRVLTSGQRRALTLGQTPFAAVLGCSDSRVSTEILFDQGLGDVFTVRVAGNVGEPATLGSVEYAVQHLKSKVIVVMGHESCGAVRAAMLGVKERMGEPQHIQELLNLIVPAVQTLPAVRDKKAREREAVVANVRHQVQVVRQDPVIRAAVQRGEVAVIGAYFEIGTGAVDFFESEEELRPSR
jgi:carbonic anhydrase